MLKIESINILDALERRGETACRELLNTYTCPLNPDVERFAREQAVDFALQRIAITYLIIGTDKESACLLGYYALANKFVNISQEKLSKTFIKKIAKFAKFDTDSQCYQVAMPLIAQLGKNFSPGIAQKISGHELLNLALDRVLEAEHILGGKTVYLECNNEPKLHDFYSSVDSRTFGERPSAVDPAETLVQMIKYF